MPSQTVTFDAVNDAAVNLYIPFLSEILDVIKRTKKEYTFRMAYEGEVRPGQFFEVSVPKFGEAPISVSGSCPASPSTSRSAVSAGSRTRSSRTMWARSSSCAGPSAMASM